MANTMDDLIWLRDFMKKVHGRIRMNGGLTDAEMEQFSAELREWEAEGQRNHMDHTSVYEDLRETILSLIHSTSWYYQL